MDLIQLQLQDDQMITDSIIMMVVNRLAIQCGLSTTRLLTQLKESCARRVDRASNCTVCGCPVCACNERFFEEGRPVSDQSSRDRAEWVVLYYNIHRNHRLVNAFSGWTNELFFLSIVRQGCFCKSHRDASTHLNSSALFYSCIMIDRSIKSDTFNYRETPHDKLYTTRAIHWRSLTSDTYQCQDESQQDLNRLALRKRDEINKLHDDALIPER